MSDHWLSFPEKILFYDSQSRKKVSCEVPWAIAEGIQLQTAWSICVDIHIITTYMYFPLKVYLFHNSQMLFSVTEYQVELGYIILLTSCNSVSINPHMTHGLGPWIKYHWSSKIFLKLSFFPQILITIERKE